MQSNRKSHRWFASKYTTKQDKTNTPKEKQEPLIDRLVAYLKEYPNTKIFTKELVAKFGVKHTTIQECLRTLRFERGRLVGYPQYKKYTTNKKGIRLQTWEDEYYEVHNDVNNEKEEKLAEEIKKASNDLNLAVSLLYRNDLEKDTWMDKKINLSDEDKAKLKKIVMKYPDGFKKYHKSCEKPLNLSNKQKEVLVKSIVKNKDYELAKLMLDKYKLQVDVRFKLENMIVVATLLEELK